MVTSATAVIAAVYAGLVTTAILSILPAVLALEGVDEATIAYVIASFFLGRLVFQIPIGIVADRMDLRLLIAIIAILTGATALLAVILAIAEAAGIVAEAGLASKILFFLITALLGGLILPLYTVANSLAFARAGGQPAVKVATTLLLVNSAGAVAGPLLVAAILPVAGGHALAWVIALTSAAMAAFALWRRVARSVHAQPATGLSDIPATSLALTETVAEVKAEARAGAGAGAAGQAEAPRPSR